MARATTDKMVPAILRDTKKTTQFCYSSIVLPTADTLDDPLFACDSAWRFPDALGEVRGQWVHTHPETDLAGLALTTHTTIR